MTWKINLFDEVAGRTAEAADAGVRKAAFEVQRQAQVNIRSQGAIDTGALINSAYTVTSRGTTRARAAAGAVRRNKRVPLAVPKSATVELGQARVAFSVEYAVFVELGVGNAFGKGIRISARPFLNPAVDMVRSRIGAIIGSEISAEFGQGARSSLGGVDGQ